jgi:ABC-type Fe3+ transport system permease subunit
VGSTLTSYIYNNSPAGEGNSPQKAYAAAFVLLIIVLGLNALVTRLSRGATLSAGARTGQPSLLRRLAGASWIR